MAPKRAAKKAAAPQPQPPPPAESSDETRSGSRSRSRSDDSEDEEAIADSPVPAATPALKNTPAPSQKGGESESSEEEEEDDEEEEEELPVRAPPKNQPPQLQIKEHSEASGGDDDDDEDDDEEEEEEEGPTRAAHPSAPKEQPPQPQKGEDSDTSGDDGESDEEEAPPPKPAPKNETAVEALKPAAAAETKKPGGIQRIWSPDDEVRILEALAAHNKQHGTLPQTDALMDVLAGKLDNPSYGSKELHSKVGTLRTRCLKLSMRGEPPSMEHDRRLLELSKMVWGGDKTTPSAAAVVAANGHGCKGFEEMCELYPFLAEEVKELEAAHPGMCKRVFGKMDDDKARSMDKKIKKQRLLQMKVETGRANLNKEVTKTLVDLVDG